MKLIRLLIGRISVPVANILAINPQSSDNHEYDAINATITTPIVIVGTNATESTETTHSQPMRKQFTVVYAKRLSNSTNLNKWRYSSITLHSNDAQVVDLWTRTLQNELNGKNSTINSCILLRNRNRK